MKWKIDTNFKTEYEANNFQSIVDLANYLIKSNMFYSIKPNIDDAQNTFITDSDKMLDFTQMEKDSFLKSYSYLSEEEYDATKAYYDWLIWLHTKEVEK